MTHQRTRIARQTFRTLHDSGCFVIPDPWDVGAARYLEHLGFRALATTSAGFAFSQGLPDSDTAVSRNRSLADIAALGVRRISVGGAFALAAWGGFTRAAQMLKTDGSFAGLAGTASYPEINGLFAANLDSSAAPLSPPTQGARAAGRV